ncbi:LuxR C-terminal-related transcriptional regulator [Streptomyces albulus]|uniref:helix-turn-helix transcriptional regulator n=1 Tax=Streptomyces noursei TaxID=1971 RepID=UPI001F1FD559|nr:LuxR C-terminal-related transcriptional regulator [Streptomyces noursei]MCE4947761.1 LuxR C-terminal-related transcriptional regulator [Streptomyces noursei]
MSEHDVARMLDLAIAALGEQEPERLWPLIVGELLRSVGGEIGVCKTRAWGGHTAEVPFWEPDSGLREVSVDTRTRKLIMNGYPFRDHYEWSADRTPVTAARAAGAREWRNSVLHSLTRRAFGTQHVLGIPVPDSAAVIRGCLVYRSGTDFTSAQLGYAQRVQPLLIGVEKQAQLLRRWRSATDHLQPAPEACAAAYDLTPREITVLTLLGDALSAGSIARRLGISVRTVHKHVANLYRKLDTRDRMATVLRAQALGILPPSAHIGA